MIYLDNAATTFPKPEQVSRAVFDYIKNCGASFGRGVYKTAADSIDILWNARVGAAEILGAADPQRVIFTKNATEALNLAIKGMLNPGAEVITSPLEHNSVIRPLSELKCNIKFLPLLSDGTADMSALRRMVSPKTDMVILTHASNVSGTINDISAAASFCRSREIPLLVDCAQSAGHIPVYSETWNAMTAFAGHKGFLAPQGTGGLYIPENYNPNPLMTGGTGSRSELLTQPEDVPEKYESGTHNMAALSGFAAACEFISETGLDEIHRYETTLCARLIDGLSGINGIKILYPHAKNRTGAVSFVPVGKDVGEVGNILDSRWGIAVRCGLHCAPLAHRVCGTLSSGTVRVSPGIFNTEKDIDIFLEAINEIMN